MSLNFSKASTQFVRNLVELGVCENADCLNAYHPPAGLHRKSIGADQRPKSLCAAATTAPSTRPLIPVDVPGWLHALDSDDFPLAEVSHLLSSSELQLSQPLERFIDELFSRASQRYHVQLETLVRALRLLERVQMTNMRAHQQVLLSQPSRRSARSCSSSTSTSTSSSSHSTCISHHAGHANSCGSDTPMWSQAPTLQPRAVQHETPQPTGSLLHAARWPTPSLGPCASAPVRIAAHAAVATTNKTTLAASPSPVLSYSPVGGRPPHHPASVNAPTRGNDGTAGFDNSSVSSGTVGPLTDTERLSYGKSCGAPASSSLTSWCLPPKSPCELSISPVHPNTAAGSVDLTSLLNRLQLCPACAGARVFTLQYYNVHLLLAACLALSISINEVAVVDAVPEDALMHQIAEMAHCTDLPLQMAVRVVCETLGGELCVFDGEVDALVHRLNIVETCVFSTEGL